MENSRSFQRTFRIPARSARNAPFGAPGGFLRIPFSIFCARAGNPAPETFVFPLLLRFPENSTNSKNIPRSIAWGDPSGHRKPGNRKRSGNTNVSGDEFPGPATSRALKGIFWDPKGAPKDFQKMIKIALEMIKKPVAT